MSEGGEKRGAHNASTAATLWAESLGGGTGDDPGPPGRQTCWAVWHEDLAAFEVLQPRGDALRSLGSTWQGRTMLHAEEGLWLVERGMLAVHPFPVIPVNRHEVITATTSMTRAQGADSALACAPIGNDGKVSTTGVSTEVIAGRRGQDMFEGVEGEGSGTGMGKGLENRKLGEENDDTIRTIKSTLEVMRNEDDRDGEREDGDKDVRHEGAVGVAGHSLSETDLSRPRACDTPDPSKAGQSSKDSSARLTAGELERDLHSRMSGGVMREGQQRCSQQKAGGKRGRPGAEKAVGSTLSLSVGALHEMALSRAGVPWECYRAYAELKRRSYVVRRQPADVIGYNDGAPRAAPLSWFGCPRATTRSAAAAATSTENNYTSEADPRNRRTCAATSHYANTSLSSSSSLPVTFHIYNRPPGAFRKRDPGPPDALLVVCRFEDAMPEHHTLVAFARHHAELSTKTLEKRQRQRSVIRGPYPGRGSQRGKDTGSEEIVSEILLLEGSSREPHRGVGASNKEHSNRGEEGRVLNQEQVGGRAEVRRMFDRGEGDSGGTWSEVDCGGRKECGDWQRHGNQAQDGEVGRDGIDGNGGREKGLSENHGGGTRTGLLSVGLLGTSHSPPGIKLAVVSKEAAVQLFDVGLHDADEVVEPLM